MAAVLAAVIGYLLGTFPTAMLVARYVGKRRGSLIDPRLHGTGNPGGANMIALTGRTWGILVMAADTTKGVLAVLLGNLLGGSAAMAAAGVAATIGHILPLWSRFRGGKGVATAGGALLAAFPAYFFPGAAFLAVLRAVTRSGVLAMFGSLAADVAAGALWWTFGWPNLWGIEASPTLFVFATLIAAAQLPKFLLDARELFVRRSSPGAAPA